MKESRIIATLFCAVSALLFGGCGVGSAKPATVGGTVTGMSGASSLVLVNDAKMLVVTADGTFHFDSETNAPYNITINTQPAGQTCVVESGTGYIPTNGSNVTSVKISCSASVLVGGTVSGLASAATVVLQNSGADPITVAANGTFAFTVPTADAAGYAVTVKTQPANQTCTVSNASGTVSATNTANAKNVIVTCVTNT